MRKSTISTLWASATGLLLAVLLSSCSAQDTAEGDTPAKDKETRQGPPLILLISIDTLRADHLGLYGHHRFTSPVLDAFAAEGTIFEDASSSAPWTLPAHASMLTGLYPRKHRVLTFDTALPPEIPTLASKMSGGGYQTAAVVNSAWLTKDMYGITRDFDKYLFVDDTQERRAPNSWITDQAIEWIREARDQPIFLFVHYYDVHSDYASLPQYERIFVTPYTGDADGTGWQLAKASFEDDYLALCHENYDPAKCRIGTLEKYLAVDRTIQKITFDDDDLRHIEELYDAGIRQLDNELGRFFSILESEGRLEEALIVITSDHGEEFMDHGRMDHFLTMYQEVLRVPLILRGPGIPAGQRIATPVSLVDLSPTILSIAGLEEKNSSDGLDLSPLLLGREHPSFESRAIYGEASGGLTYEKMMEGVFPIYRSLRRGRHKIIHDSKTQKWLLYDLESDPGESRDLSEEKPEITRRLAAEMRERYRDFDPTPSPQNRVELEVEQLERLRALGYVP
ncbi:MAG: sulfatase [Myxococcota bacterium]|nr:sulfatase [Myxococcota bacterium]